MGAKRHDVLGLWGAMAGLAPWIRPSQPSHGSHHGSVAAPVTVDILASPPTPDLSPSDIRPVTSSATLGHFSASGAVSAGKAPRSPVGPRAGGAGEGRGRGTGGGWVGWRTRRAGRSANRRVECIRSGALSSPDLNISSMKPSLIF